METKTRRTGCLGSIGRVLLIISGVLIVMGIAGEVVRADLRSKYPPPGQLVDVGGYRLHIDCQGNGSPTVIVEAGQGGMGAMYRGIQEELSRTTRVCTYDRAGLGWSDLSKKPRAAQVIIEELHMLLQRAGIDGPYILVGHSLGGLFSLMYAHTYPHETAGVVLLDSPHMDRFLRAPQKEIDGLRSVVKLMPAVYNVLAFATLTGIPTLFMPAPLADVDGYPPETAAVNSAVLRSSIRVIRGTGAELRALEAIYEQVQAANIKTLGSIPVIAISHTRPEGYMNMTAEEIDESERMWRQFQNELAGLSNQGQVILADNAGHNLHLERPDLVTEAIIDILQAASEQSVEKQGR